MKNITKLGIALSITCLIAAGVLVPVNLVTRERIEKNKTAAETQAMKIILPPGVDESRPFVEKKIGEVTFIQAFNASGQVVALVAKASGQGGYGGELTVMVSVNKDGRIGRVIVTEHKETPGIGSTLTDRVERKSLSEVFAGKDHEQGPPPNDFLDQFSAPELSELAQISNFTLRDDRIRPVTGATVTSRAVTNAVEKISRAFSENREILFQP